MRFSRVVSANNCTNPLIDQLAENAGLDLLQLDYRWPITHLPDEQPLATYAAGFIEQLLSLHRWLYLDPQLRLITNAGGGDTLGCVEALAEYLSEHDHGELPMTQVRGDNVLASLDELVAAGLELRDIVSGELIEWQAQAIFSAQVEIGAGPLATALSEGSRVVVAGCYDLAAPSIAAATTNFGWSWDAFDRLSQVALAANLDEVVVEIEQAGRSVITPHPRGTTPKLAKHELNHADVLCQVPELEPQHLENEAFEFAGVTGKQPADEWLLRLVRQAGNAVEAVMQCTDVTQEILANKLANELNNTNVKLERLSSANASDSGFWRVCCFSATKVECDHLVRDLLNLCVRYPKDIQLLGRLPSTSINLESVYCRVPRDLITVSVDTRSASEWR